MFVIYVVLYRYVFCYLIIVAFYSCKSLRPCYSQMLESLRHADEETCIEDAVIGSSSVVIFLKALNQFCGDIIKVQYEYKTFESRHLYEVTIEHNTPEIQRNQKPVIIIDAGMEGGADSTNFGLYIIEQLTACKEYEEMIEKVRWVILPCVNPDGLEHDAFFVGIWRKNSRPSEERLGIGVDISRNFDSQWGSCPRVDSPFAPNFPGLAPSSENETVFVKNTLNKYKKDAKIYLSIKRNGHAILFPYAYTKNQPSNHVQLEKITAEVASKVNQKAGGVHLFVNNSIYDFEGKPHCGHNVDFAHEMGIPLSFEMRVFLGYDNFIMSKFQALPRGYENSLRSGYFSGIREFYNVITNEKKYGRVY
ncbi:hypothetical protein K1T71_010317 [Dendrolimus kikuchii]|uniref:Uncharacterized protein n=1 Tax=Dendrolimus kikuchii TaxID=765133 RepID=A0ACC1CRL7_9NEOP|nr:hypothetical protein K1T71_010317 [Dendrolimus kikuchii]